MHHEVVRVIPLMSHLPLKQLPTMDLPSSPVRSPTTATADRMTGPKGMAELDVNISYTAGCQRGHISRLGIPVLTPFRYCQTLPRCRHI